MFMSYDSGATAASLPSIVASDPVYWTSTSLALLGGMDKIGTCISAPIWGRLLQMCSTKCLMAIGLASNACFTFVFGIGNERYLMLGMKFLMGATQSLQNVWGSVWTVNMAPPELKTQWMTLGGISAAIGTAVGTGVAGFGTANGLPYSFAFILQASVLAAFLVCLIVTPPSMLSIAATQGVDVPPERKECSGEESSSTGGQLRYLLRNRIYVWTLVATCLNQYQTIAIQYYFVLIFGSVWGLDQNYTTTMVLVVPGIGMLFGIVIGPRYFDSQFAEYGGFSTLPGMVRCLEIARKLSSTAVIGSICGIIGIYLKFRGLDRFDLPNEGDLYLYVVWGGIVMLSFGHSACIAAITSINTECVEEDKRSFASGIETSIRNLLGYFAGTFTPGLVMDLTVPVTGWNASEDGNEQNWVRCTGLGFIFLCGLPATFFLSRARAAASQLLAREQELKMQEIKGALERFSKDTQNAACRRELEMAVKEGDRLRLSHSAAGQAVMAHANAVLDMGSMQSSEDNVVNETMMELRKANEQLVLQNEKLSNEVDELKQEVARLRSRQKSSQSISL